mgnify:CR=1 FL=1
MSRRPFFNEPWRESFGLQRPNGATTEYIYGFGEAEDSLSKLFEWPERTRWIIELEKPTGHPTTAPPDLVTIRLLPGVSIKEARKAAETAVRRLGKQGTARRPSIPRTVVDALNKIFEAIEPEIDRHGFRKRSVDICEAFLKMAGKPVSRSLIQKELLRWLRQRKHRVKRYSH